MKPQSVIDLDTGASVEVDALGRSLENGRFVRGQAKAGPGRPKGSRNKMTQIMLSRVHKASEEGCSPEDIMIQIMKDVELPPELRFKAAAKVADLVYPRAASVEVKVEESEGKSIDQIQDQIKMLLASAQAREEG